MNEEDSKEVDAALCSQCTCGGVAFKVPCKPECAIFNWAPRTAPPVQALVDETLRKMSDNRGSHYVLAEVLQVLKHSGIDIECGACMETAFTGVTMAGHSCKPSAVVIRLFKENRKLRAKLIRAKAFLKSLVFRIDELKLDEEVPRVATSEEVNEVLVAELREQSAALGRSVSAVNTSLASAIELNAPAEVKACTECCGSGQGPDYEVRPGQVDQGKDGAQRAAEALYQRIRYANLTEVELVAEIAAELRKAAQGPRKWGILR